MSEVKLMPCPLCGPGKSIVSLYQQDTNHYWVIGCGACGLHSGTHKDREVVVSHWNTRQPSPALSVAVEALEKVLVSSRSPDPQDWADMLDDVSDALAKIKGEVGE